MKKIIVAAKSANNALGKHNKLLWHMPADLRFFYRTIKDQYLLTGRKSYASQQGSEIFKDKSKTFLVTRKKNFRAPKAVVCHSIEEALSQAEKARVSRLYILGGSQIYDQTIDLANQLIITEIHAVFDADVFFPTIDPSIWVEKSRQDFQKDKENQYDYSFVSFERIK